MIFFTENTSVYISIPSIDFRAGISKMAFIVANVLENKDPMSDTLFIFRNKRKTDIKGIYYDGSGYLLIHKRLSKGRLNWWPRTEKEQCNLPLKNLNMLLRGCDPRSDFNPNMEYIDIGKGIANKRRENSQAFF